MPNLVELLHTWLKNGSSYFDSFLVILFILFYFFLKASKENAKYDVSGLKMLNEVCARCAKTILFLGIILKIFYTFCYIFIFQYYFSSRYLLLYFFHFLPSLYFFPFLSIYEFWIVLIMSRYRYLCAYLENFIKKSSVLVTWHQTVRHWSSFWTHYP